MLGGNRLCVQLWARPSTLLCSSLLVCEMGLIWSLEPTRRGLRAVLDAGEGCNLASHGHFITGLLGSGDGTVTSTPPSSPKYVFTIIGPSEFKSPDRAPGCRLCVSEITQAHEERLGLGRKAGTPGSQVLSRRPGGAGFPRLPRPAPGAPYPLRVQVVHGLGDGAQHCAGLPLREVPLPQDAVQQLAAAHQLRHQVHKLPVVVDLGGESARPAQGPPGRPGAQGRRAGGTGGRPAAPPGGWGRGFPLSFVHIGLSSELSPRQEGLLRGPSQGPGEADGRVLVS